MNLFVQLISLLTSCKYTSNNNNQFRSSEWQKTKKFRCQQGNSIQKQKYIRKKSEQFAEMAQNFNIEIRKKNLSDAVAMLAFCFLISNSWKPLWLDHRKMSQNERNFPQIHRPLRKSTIWTHILRCRWTITQSLMFVYKHKVAGSHLKLENRERICTPRVSRTRGPTQANAHSLWNSEV